MVRRTLPKVFGCPRCGMVSVKVTLKEGTSASVMCGGCGLSKSYVRTSRREPIDIYNDFVDNYLTARGPT